MTQELLSKVSWSEELQSRFAEFCSSPDEKTLAFSCETVRSTNDNGLTEAFGKLWATFIRTLSDSPNLIEPIVLKHKLLQLLPKLIAQKALENSIECLNA